MKNGSMRKKMFRKITKEASLAGIMKILLLYSIQQNYSLDALDLEMSQ